MTGRGLVLATLLIGVGCGTPPARTVAPSLGDALAVRAIGPAFEDARALARDPQGALYVADAGAATVVVLSSDGVPRRTLGGPGTGDYAFLDPSGLDPSNGLVLTVADTGNGRLQRFSHDGRLLETVAVPTARTDRDQSFGARDTPGDDRRLGPGRPLAVASAVTGELFAIEETEGVVLRWDDRHDVDRVVGGRGAGEGSLKSPVGLALGPDGRLFVADRGHAAVLVYDAFGHYLRRIGDGQLADIAAIAVVGDRLAVALHRQVYVYALDGQRVESFAVNTEDSLVGVAGDEDDLFLLTRSTLLRAESRRR